MTEINSVHDLPENIKSTTLFLYGMFNEIYLTGGAVRDSIMDISTDDLDFTTPIPADKVRDILNSNNITTRDVGLEYGTVSLNLRGLDIQITTFREEFYEPNSRKPLITTAPDIDADLSRRDFSINSMALSAEELIDPYDGTDAIRRKVIECVGDPEIKFKEDPLRILRAFRFVSQFGFNIEEKTLLAAMSLKSNLGIVSKERIGIELQKIILGDFWDDSLNEIASAKVLNMTLKTLGITFSVSEDDVLHELTKYSADQLRSMKLIKRWELFINILDYARSAAGVDSIDKQTLAEKILIASQMKRSDKDSILSSLSIVDSSKLQSDSGDSRSIGDSLKEGEELKRKNDPRWMIVLATYYTIVGKNSIKNGHYKKSRDNLNAALDISLENRNYILKNFESRPEERDNKLKVLGQKTRDRIRYLILAEIFDDKLYSKFKSTKDLTEYLLKEHRHHGISAADLRASIEHVIASMYRRAPHPITLEPFLKFLKRTDLSIDDDSIRRYTRGLIEDRIRNKSTPPSEKASLYLQKANVAQQDADNSLGFEYYDPYVDYLFNSMISVKSMDDFNKFYDEFVIIATEYLDLSEKWRRYNYGKRNMYLTSASALVHAIQISDSVEMRSKISQRVVEDYKEARSIKNASRYQIYVDWFNFVSKLLNTSTSKEGLNNLVEFTASLESLNYEDEDEGYLTQYRPDLVRKRSLLRDAYVTLANFARKSVLGNNRPSDEVLLSLLVLQSSSLMDYKNLFKILKNHIAEIESEVDSIDQVEVPEKTLKRVVDDAEEVYQLLTGESETLEYKSTWNFDLNIYRRLGDRKNNPELKHEVVKNIAGMMNKGGGILLIGVEDDGNVCGLEEGDYIMQSSPNHSKKLDNIQKDIRNEIRNRLGGEVQAVISIKTLSFKDNHSKRRTVIKIDIPKAVREPIICRNNDGSEIFYVRTGTSTDDAGIRAYSQAKEEISQRLKV